MALNYLIFDQTEADDGSGGFDTMASATAVGWPALQAELVQVLAWSHGQFPNGPGAVDEGNDWDCELRSTQERSSSQSLYFDAASGRLQTRPNDEPEWLRHTVTLCISGTPAFCLAFAQRFLQDNDDGSG